MEKDGAEDRGGNQAYANDLKDRCQRRLRQRRLRHAEKAAVWTRALEAQDREAKRICGSRGSAGSRIGSSNENVSTPGTKIYTSRA